MLERIIEKIKMHLMLYFHRCWNCVDFSAIFLFIKVIIIKNFKNIGWIFMIDNHFLSLRSFDLGLFCRFLILVEVFKYNFII